MTALIVAIAAVCAFMFLSDVFGTGLVISMGRGLKFYPGAFDGLGDFVGRYGTGISAYAVVHWGLTSWQFLVITLSVAATSFGTSNLATGKESLILPKDRLDHVSLHEMWRRLKGKP